MGLRKTLLWVHRWLTLVFGVWVLLMTVTGTALVFTEDIDRRLNSELFRETKGPTTTSVDAATTMVNERYADWLIVDVTLPPKMAGVYEFMLFPLDFSIEKELRVYVDPGSGRILGTRDPEGGLTRWMLDIHAGLLLGKTGRPLIFAIGLVFVFLLGTGLYLWWPRLALWRAKFRLRRGRGRIPFHYDLHQLVGIFALPGLAVIVMTGVIFTYPGVAKNLWYGLIRTEQTVSLSDRILRAERRPTPVLTYEELVKRAEAAAPGGKVIRLTLPESDDDAVLVWLEAGRDPFAGRASFSGNVTMQIDPYTGQILAREDPSERPALVQFFDRWLYPLHMGSFGGWPVRLLYGLIGLTPFVLAFTGVMLWWLRRRRRKAAPDVEVVLPEIEEEIIDLEGLDDFDEPVMSRSLYLTRGRPE